jgi:hypothetical protein
MANEIDVVGLILTIAMWVVLGTVLAVFLLFKDKLPFLPRKYFKVEIFKSEDDKEPQKTKGWFINQGGVQKFRVLLRGITGTWAGVNLDRSFIKTMNDDGILELIEVTPGVIDASNYLPKNIILTQKDGFIKEILMNVNDDSKEMFEMKIRDAFHKFSRVTDLNESRWLSDNIAIKRAQRNRVSGDAWIEKFLPFIALIAIGFFMYLAYDSLGKSFNNAVTSYGTITAYHTNQIVQACGGTFVPMETKNETKPASTNPIPFMGG